VPRPLVVSMPTTAAHARPTMSSSGRASPAPEGIGVSAVVAGASAGSAGSMGTSRGAAAVRGGAAVRGAADASSARSVVALATGAGATPGPVLVEFAAGCCCRTYRAAASATTSTATSHAFEFPERSRSGVSIASTLRSKAGASAPQRHCCTRPGTCRPHEGQVQADEGVIHLVIGGSGKMGSGLFHVSAYAET